MRLKLFPALFLFFLLLGSCKVPKDVAYFQGVDKLTPERLEAMSQTYTSQICPDDLLTITVTSWDPTVVTPFNPPTYAYAAQGESHVSFSEQLQTYLVDSEGNISFPVIGKVKAAGLSRQQLAENLRSSIATRVPDAQVNVQIVNYEITVLGEVARPGIITIKNDRVSILDALGRVGDLGINANRKNILVMRDNNGQKEFGRMDITSPDIFTSPYYYLHQNDVVYVEPNDPKKKNANYSQAQQYTITIVSTILTAVSIITSVVINVVK